MHESNILLLTPPPPLNRPHYCKTSARLLRNIRPCGLTQLRFDAVAAARDAAAGRRHEVASRVQVRFDL